MYWRLIGIVLTVLALGAAAMTSAKEGTETKAVAAASEWLALIDRGEYGKGWNEAASFMRGQIASQDFQKQVAGVRVPLGKVITRKLLSKTAKSSLPGVPDGQYVIIQFNTTFEKKKSAIETITPMLETDGTWRVSGYYIR